MANKNVNSSDVVRAERSVLTQVLTCSICNNIFDDPVNIRGCVHIFCRRCICKKIEEEYLNRCPVCNDSWVRPLENLRPDHNWSSIRETIAPLLTKRAKNDNIAEGECRDNQVSENAEEAAPVLGRRRERSLTSLVNQTQVSGPTPMTRRRNAHGRKVYSSRDSALSIEKPNKSVEGRSDGSGFTASSSRSGRKNLRIYDVDSAVESTPISVPIPRPTKKTRGRPKKINISQELDLNVPAQATMDSPSNQPGKRVVPIWLSLVPSASQEGIEPLPQIPPCYVMIKNTSLPVSYIKKYVVQKLNLDSENEVALSLFGADLPSDLQLHSLMNEWSKTISESEKFPVVTGGSGQDFVMVLSYGRPRHC